MENDALAHLNTEADELEAKINALGLFIESAEYRALNMDHRVVLASRLMAMCSYLSCLNHEILLLNHTSDTSSDTTSQETTDDQPEPSDGC